MKKLIILSLIAFYACTPVGVKTINTNDLDLAVYQTYNYLKFSYAHYDSIPYNEQNYAYLIEQMDKHMKAKGMSLADDPNLVMNIGVVIRQEQQTRETDVRTDMNYAGQRNYHWESEEQVVGVYDVGDVTIDFVDTKKDILVWQASIDGMMSKNEKKMKERIDYAVEKIFESFPAK